jgi:hypothetical protein
VLRRTFHHSTYLAVANSSSSTHRPQAGRAFGTEAIGIAHVDKCTRQLGS